MVGVKISVWWRECPHKDRKEDGGNSEDRKMRNDIFCNALWSDKKPIDGALKGFSPLAAMMSLHPEGIIAPSSEHSIYPA